MNEHLEKAIMEELSKYCVKLNISPLLFLYEKGENDPAVLRVCDYIVKKTAKFFEVEEDQVRDLAIALIISGDKKLFEQQ